MEKHNIVNKEDALEAAEATRSFVPYWTFNEKLKNEDAEPYADNAFAAIADGMGYSGSFVHRLSTDSDKIFAYLFGDINKSDPRLPEMKALTAQQFCGLKESEFQTSAYWGSRILLLRAIYKYKLEGGIANAEDARTRSAWRDFLIGGLKAIKKAFGLSCDEANKKYLFASTFAAISYSPVSADKLRVRAVWAGDSRCYYMNKDGLKQLSIDDEDETGALSNMFCLSERVKPALRGKEFLLDAPCVLFAASDGIFDCFAESLGFERTMLEVLTQKDTMEDFKNGLRQFFNTHKTDDASIAFAAVGYEDYRSLKAAFTKRTEYISNLLKSKQTFRYMETLKRNPDTLKACNEYIENRILTAHIRQKFFQHLVERALKGGKEPWLSEELKKFVAKSVQMLKEEYNVTASIEKTKAAENFIEYLSKISAKSSRLWTNPIFDKNGKIKRIVGNIINKENAIGNHNDYYFACLRDISVCQTRIDNYRAEAFGKAAAARANIARLDMLKEEDFLKGVSEAQTILDCGYIISTLRDSGTGEQSDNKNIDKRATDLIASLREAKSKATAAEKESEKLNKQKSQFESELSKALAFLLNDSERCLALIDILLKEDTENSVFIQKLKTALTPREFALEDDDAAKIVNRLIESKNLPEIVKDMTAERWKAPEESELDSSFNAKSFGDYIEYNNTSAASNPEFEAYLNEYEAYMTAYNSLIA